MMNKLFAELRRRNIFRIAGVYAITGWILAQISGVLESALNLPHWFDTIVVTLLLIGFPIALLFAWAFEMTPEGVKRTEAVADGTSITPKTGRKLDFAILGGLVLVALLVIWQGTRPASAPLEANLGDITAPAENEIDPASIAVLPFADLSPNKDQEYFSDGMAEEILNVLVRTPGLKVASRTSAFGFKGQEALGIPVIAKKLNVRHVLEGSVRKSGDTIRITAQLIDAQTDQHLWSETYDRELSAENIFAIQDEIANEIVKQLSTKISGESPKTPNVRVAAGTENLDAYELFLRAHAKLITRKDIPGTIALYERAVAADPGFARAWAGLAAAYRVAPSWFITDRDYDALAISSANKAIALNPNLALPYAVLGLLAGTTPPFDFDEGFAQLDQATKLDPKETTAWLWRGVLNVKLGYFDKAEQDFRQCLTLDPAYELCRRYIAEVKFYMGDTKRALVLFEQGRMKDFRGNDSIFLNAYAAMGKFSTVLSGVYYETGSRNTNNAAEKITLEYRAITEPDFDFEKERAAIEALYARTDGKPLDWSHPDTQLLAFGYRNYAAVKNPNIYNSIWWYSYPAALKASPHQKRWMVELGLPEFWRKNGFPPQCKPVGKDDFVCD
jgi:TolB-like protein